MQNEKLEVMKAQRAVLDQQIAAAEKESRAAVVAQARQLLASVGLACTVSAAKAQATAGIKVPPKYRCKITGATWTGRGKTPAWYRDARCQDEIEFLGAK